MHRVYVAWDAAEARRFLAVLRGRGINGRVIEDEDVRERGGLHDAESAPEVWITDESRVPEALELASDFEKLREPARGGEAPESDPKS